MNVDSPFHGAREVWLTQFKSIREGDVCRIWWKCGRAVQKAVTITDFFVTAVGQLASQAKLFSVL